MQRHSDFAEFDARGAYLEGAMLLADPAWLNNEQLAFDAQPGLSTSPNSGIPSWLTTVVDPQIYKVLFAPNEGASILGEELKGDWLTQTAMFPITENTGEVSSYGDYSNNGSAGVNVNFPQRQSYVYQTMLSYGEMEMERAAEARIGWASEVQQSGIFALNKFQNLTYHFGVGGLQNYGILNEPALSAALTPGPKANGGVQWVVNGVVNATPNEVYLDIQSLFIKLVQQNNGLVKAKDRLVLVTDPESAVALTAVNTFNVDVYDQLRKNYPNIRFETDPLYGAASPSNPQGNAAGNMVQLFVESVQAQKTGYCAFNVKLRSHKMIVDTSSFKQKLTQGTWGFILRQPTGVSTMVGV